MATTYHRIDRHSNDWQPGTGPESAERIELPSGHSPWSHVATQSALTGPLATQAEQVRRVFEPISIAGLARMVDAALPHEARARKQVLDATEHGMGVVVLYELGDVAATLAWLIRGT